MSTATIGVTFVACATGGCSALIAFPEGVETRARASGETFYCTSGHGSHFKKPKTPARTGAK